MIQNFWQDKILAIILHTIKNLVDNILVNAFVILHLLYLVG